MSPRQRPLLILLLELSWRVSIPIAFLLTLISPWNWQREATYFPTRLLVGIMKSIPWIYLFLSGLCTIYKLSVPENSVKLWKWAQFNYIFLYGSVISNINKQFGWLGIVIVFRHILYWSHNAAYLNCIFH